MYYKNLDCYSSLILVTILFFILFLHTENYYAEQDSDFSYRDFDKVLSISHIALVR